MTSNFNSLKNNTHVSVLFLEGIEDESRKLYGVQFHPEVDLTENGVTMIKNFLFGVSIIYNSPVKLASIAAVEN